MHARAADEKSQKDPESGSLTVDVTWCCASEAQR